MNASFLVFLAATLSGLSWFGVFMIVLGRLPAHRRVPRFFRSSLSSLSSGQARFTVCALMSAGFIGAFMSAGIEGIFLWGLSGPLIGIGLALSLSFNLSFSLPFSGPPKKPTLPATPK